MQSVTKVSQHRLIASSGQSVAVFRYAGDLSSASKDAVLGSYQSSKDSGQTSVLLDFSNVDYLNSSGIALVLQMLTEARQAKQKLAICGLAAHFTKVFAMVGITKYAALYPDEVTALAAL